MFVCRPLFPVLRRCLRLEELRGMRKKKDFVERLKENWSFSLAQKEEEEKEKEKNLMVGGEWRGYYDTSAVFFVFFWKKGEGKYQVVGLS